MVLLNKNDDFFSYCQSNVALFSIKIKHHFRWNDIQFRKLADKFPFNKMHYNSKIFKYWH